MRMCGLLCWAVAGLLGWQVYKKLQAYQANQKPQTVEPLKNGAKPTGRVQRTQGRKPNGEEMLGVGVRDWMEIVYPTGELDWVELKS